MRLTVTEDEQPIVQAVIEHMWNEAQLRMAGTPGKRASAPGPVAQTQGLPPAADPNTVTSEKIPKQLPAAESHSAVPDPNLKEFLGRFRSRLKGGPIILLSFCDGIGSASWALEWLKGGLVDNHG